MSYGKNTRDGVVGDPLTAESGAWLTEVASWPGDTSIILSPQTIERLRELYGPCSEGFHEHKNGMIHVSIELIEEERKRFEEFLK